MTEVIDKLNELKLFGMKEGLDCRLTEASQSDLSHQEFLELILDDESLYRENRRANMLRKRAKFRDKVTLEEFDTTDPKRGINKTMIKKLQSLSFLKSHENIILTGGTGAGKSYLAQAIGHCACIVGHETLFVPTCMLFTQLETAEKAGTLLNTIKRLASVEVLILDDFALRNYTHHEATLLYQVLEDRYQKGATIVTSQVKPSGWKSLFEDPVIAEAIVDRLVACAHKIDVKGPSYRGNHTPKNQIGLDA